MSKKTKNFKSNKGRTLTATQKTDDRGTLFIAREHSKTVGLHRVKDSDYTFDEFILLMQQDD